MAKKYLHRNGAHIYTALQYTRRRIPMPVKVEDAILQSCRSVRRRPREVPYPVQHIGAACSTFDVWNNMFRTQGQNLTLHKFENSPAYVLDLGCGSGYWAIEAAKRWPNCTIFGMDIEDIQPKLHHPKTRKYHLDIAHRVKWVHGNLLDGLPFHCNYFDFVRMVNIGLGVPEDEWQYLFEAREVLRVLKPGGVVEVIEEDPIFPCEVRPKPGKVIEVKVIQEEDLPCEDVRPVWDVHHGNSSVTLVNYPSSPAPLDTSLANGSSPTIWSDPSKVTLHERFNPDSLSLPTNVSSRTTPPPAHPLTSPYTTSRLLSPPRPCDDPPNTPERPSAEVDRSPNLKDHSRLKAAWDAMLYSRFLPENTLSVLRFYLSTTFSNLQTMSPVKVLLPPNSEMGRSSPERASSQSFFMGARSAKLNGTPSLVGASSLSTCSSEQDTIIPTPPGLSRTSYTTEFAQMHLASTVHTVTGCKEAIWQEYRKLYDVNVAKVVSPNAHAPSGYIASFGPGNVKSSIRESFDDDWAAWYNDMTDRIGMRTLMSRLSWDEPPGQRPDWHIWRAKVQQASENKDSDSSDDPVSSDELPFLCRSMRTFIASKPKA